MSKRPERTLNRYSHTAITMMYAMGHSAVSRPSRPAPATAVTGMWNTNSATSTCTTRAITPDFRPVSLKSIMHARNTTIGMAATRAVRGRLPRVSSDWVHMASSTTSGEWAG